MSDIEVLVGVEPRRENEYPLYYKVGVDGVTRIEVHEVSPEPYCQSWYYNVYRGDHLHTTVNDAAVGQIIYFDPTTSTQGD